MTDEQRLDRLERIVKLMIKAGLRARRQSREQDEKMNILIAMHMENEERFAKNFTDYEGRLTANEGRFAKNQSESDERFARHEERLAKNEELLATLSTKAEEEFAMMALSQAQMEKRLKSFRATLKRIINERGNANP
jgi:uncharacterized coiled-coil protein SlyX